MSDAEFQHIPHTYPAAHDTTQVCDVCAIPVGDRFAFDEDGSVWCHACMDAWEKREGRHWEDGTPLQTQPPTQETKQ